MKAIVVALLACVLVPGRALAQQGQAAPAQGNLNTITSVNVRGGTVEIVGTKKPNFTTFTMTDPPRMVIDISEAVFSGVKEDITVGNGTITAIRTASYGTEESAIARVLIGYEREVETDIQASGNSLVVSVAAGKGAVVAEKPIAPAGTAPTGTAPAGAVAAGPGTAPAGTAPAGTAPTGTAAAGAATARGANAEQAAVAAQGDRQQQERAAAQSAAAAQADRQQQEHAVADSAAAAQGDRQQQERAAAQSAAAAPASAEAQRQAQARAEAEHKAQEESARVASQQAEQQRLEEERAAKQATAAAEKQRQQDAARAAAEEKKHPRQESRQARVAQAETPRRAPAQGDSLAVSSRRKTMTLVGFKQEPTASRVFVRTNEPVSYTVTEGDKQLILELENTRISEANNARRLDTSFFDTAVASVDANPGPSRTVRVAITLKQQVPYQTHQEGNEVSIEFQRSVRH